MRAASPPGPRTRAFVDWTLKYGRWIWIVALALAVPATWRTVQLYVNLKSDIEELLPRDAPSVKAVNELRARSPGLQHLGVVVDTGDSARMPQGERFIDDLASRIRAYPPELVRSVRTGTEQERAFIETHAALYVDLPDLKLIRARIEARRDYDVSRETGSLLDDDEPPPSLDFSDIEGRYKGKLPKRGNREGDRYSSKELHLTMLLVEVGGFETGTGKASALLSRVKADVRALGGPDAYGGGMKLGYGGDVAIAVEELDALIEDLLLSSVLVLIATVAVIILYYRWSRSVLVLVPPLLMATVYAFAVASLPVFGVTELNSNTAFLGSIIVGNGVNVGIMLLARYVEERRRGLPLRDALVVAVGSVRLGTLSAALGAGVAYASLVSTQFRGFRQFGIIGGIGMLMSWCVAFVCMPPLIAWLDRRGVTAVDPRRESHLMAKLALAVQKHRVAIATAGLVLTVLAVLKVSTFGMDQLEYDTSKLRRRDTWVSGEGFWGGKMDTVLGQYLTPTVMLTDSPEQARALAASLREQTTRPPLAQMVDSVRTIEDVLPPKQAEKLAEAAAIRADLTPKIRSLIAPDKRDALDRIIGREDAKPITAADLPPTFVKGLMERDGTVGRTVLVFPRFSKALWQGPSLVAFVGALRAIGTSAGPEPARVAGSLPVSADILGSIQHDGTIASALALTGVVAVVLVIFRMRSTAIYVIGSLVTGVLWMTAANMVLGVKINFANFIAFPITFGIGVDYAVNIMSRYVLDGRRDAISTVRATGSAVALCSLTTIIGYSSLLIAANRALFLFGVVAVLGELACLAVAVTLLPAVLLMVEHRRAPEHPAVTPGE